MTDMPTHTPFPGEPDVTRPDYEPGGPALPETVPETGPDTSPLEMPDSQPFNDDGSTAG